MSCHASSEVLVTIPRSCTRPERGIVAGAIAVSRTASGPTLPLLLGVAVVPDPTVAPAGGTAPTRSEPSRNGTSQRARVSDVRRDRCTRRLYLRLGCFSVSDQPLQMSEIQSRARQELLR